MLYKDTPDGGYLVVRGRLRRKSDPLLSADARSELVAQLMRARRALKRYAPAAQRLVAMTEVDRATCALGERGPVWWTDGAPDYNRRLLQNTPYAAWHLSV